MKNKIIPIFLVVSVTIGFSGCGSATAPVTNGNVVESTEEMVGNSTETTVESSDEATNETESKAGGSDKPVETAGPADESSSTEKPTEPTASPTEKPQATATPTPEPTPEPTATPHVHDFKVESSVPASCTAEGQTVKVCNCGEKQVEAIPMVEHSWVTQYTQVQHEALGHVEQEQVQVGTSDKRTEYECAYCGARFDTPSGVVDHCASYVSEGNIDHAFARTIAWDYPGEPIYEIQNVWVVDQEAWTENVPNGEKCSTCGATKQPSIRQQKGCLAVKARQFFAKNEPINMCYHVFGQNRFQCRQQLFRLSDDFRFRNQLVYCLLGCQGT